MYEVYKSNEALTVNLTETLLFDELDEGKIFYRNIDIKRTLSSVYCLYSVDDMLGGSHSTKLFSLKDFVHKAVIIGSIGSSKVAILPRSIFNMLQQGVLCSSGLGLLWEAFRALSGGLVSNQVLNFPENSIDKWIGGDGLDLVDVLSPLGLSLGGIGGNLLLCNPVYHTLLIVEPGLSQEEFSHFEAYLRYGGNIVLSADNVIADEKERVYGD